MVQSQPTDKICEMEENKNTPEYKLIAATDTIKKEDILSDTSFVKNEVLTTECSCSYSQDVEVGKSVQSQERYDDGTMASPSSSLGKLMCPFG